MKNQEITYDKLLSCKNMQRNFITEYNAFIDKMKENGYFSAALKHIAARNRIQNDFDAIA